MATSGRAVVFAGCIVTASLLPAMVGFAGTAIDRLRVGRRRRDQISGITQGFWWASSRRVQRRPWLAAAATVAVLILLALLFGFSMDCQVFLVSRIREERRAGVSDSDAVANGLAGTGRVITSAAAIMICVFAAFVLGDRRVLRVIGLGMAVAVLLDATLVRMVATPAVLQLLGRATWWFPRLSRSRGAPG